MKSIRRFFSFSSLCLAFACTMLGRDEHPDRQGTGRAPHPSAPGQTRPRVSWFSRAEPAASWSTARFATPEPAIGRPPRPEAAFSISHIPCPSSPGTFVGALSTLTKRPSRSMEMRLPRQGIRVPGAGLNRSHSLDCFLSPARSHFTVRETVVIVADWAPEVPVTVTV